ncbi:MAG: TonB-dependent receptor [Flavobacteriaceae bacterium]|nr:TonB-dependent receptor [Flavobacteriaceae bacterium]
MKNIILTIFLSITAFGFAQQATIKGTVNDKDADNQTLPFANVQIKGTSIGTTTDLDGFFTLTVAPGTYTIVFSFIGYETIEIPNLKVNAGETITVNQALGAGSVVLEAVEVSATITRESESAILTEQKTATIMQTKIGSQELSRKGVGDVASGLTKATGIARESGKFYIRGLADRYNNAYLNGLPLPSIDPKLKLINLEIFSTNVVENLGIYKTYTPELYGDFAGASINIDTKDNPGNGYLEIEVGSSVNSNAQFNDFFLLNGSKYDYFGIEDGSRRPPSLLRAFKAAGLTYDSRRAPIYQFDTSFNPSKRFGDPNTNVSVNAGKRFKTGGESRLDVIVNGSFSQNQKASLDGLDVALNAQGEVLQSSFFGNDFKKYEFTTNATLLGSLVFRSDLNNKFSYTALLINDTSDELREISGVSGENADNILKVRRGTFKQNTLQTHQLAGQHLFNNRQFVFDWGGSYSRSTGNVPERRQLFFTELSDGRTVFGKSGANNNSDNHRFYQNLDENDYSAKFSLDVNLGKDADGNFKHKFTVGLNVRDKSRDFRAQQINIFFDALQNENVDFRNPDALLSQENFEREVYHVEEFIRPQNSYKADLRNFASFANFEFKFSDRLIVNAGLRIEDYRQRVFFAPEGLIDVIKEESIDEDFYLPSLSVKYALNEKSNLRFASSKTVTLPLFTELAPFLDEDINESTLGNVLLKQSDNYNVDLKWEYFPDRNEIISATAFFKYLDSPIEKVRVASVNNNVSFVNSNEALVAGIELEYRQKLGKIFGSGQYSALNDFYLGANATGMFTEVRLDPTVTIGNGSSIAPTNTTRRMQGASPFLINADINYNKIFGKHDLSTTLDVNYFDDRIYAAGGNEVDDVYEKGFATLNFTLVDKIGEHFEFKITGRNLLDPNIERYQDQRSLGREITVSKFNLGADFGLGVTYKF